MEVADSAGLASPTASDPVRILVIGAGSRGNAYAKAIEKSSLGVIVAVSEPVEQKCLQFGRRYIWGDGEPAEGQRFGDWTEFLRWEQRRRQGESAGVSVSKAIDAVFVCTLDDLHPAIVVALAPLKVHIMCEKPLAATLHDCLDVNMALLDGGRLEEPEVVFGIAHVLRYSPHNMLLYKLLREEEVIGDIISVEHTEQIGWWHFAHSYVRVRSGNWRNKALAGESLLTKSCHDIDFLLWLLSSPPPGSQPTCMYSAKRIYRDRLRDGVTGWPVKIVLPEIEECVQRGGLDVAEEALMSRLADDYGPDTDLKTRLGRSWYGRCVWEADNTVCDDQLVTMEWRDEVHDEEHNEAIPNRRRRLPKRVSFHMVAFTEQMSQRRSRFYGTRGELEADGTTIRVQDFASGRTPTYHPSPGAGAHGGGDVGLVQHFLRAVDAVKNHGVAPGEAQRAHLGCTLDEIIRSHAVVFAAEMARKAHSVVEWSIWWKSQQESHARHWPKR
ncbi:MAG: hypothetical protein M1826_004034 [Phylliscum demangeonii]|nr:MAG: hypothetical protein M1826_004034 [Phylliscum demangeonii]